jgi:putative transposase
MREIKIATGEYYHIYNRGNNKQNIFRDERDWVRLLFLILYLQSPERFPQIGRLVSFFVKNSAFDIQKDLLKKIIKNRYVELINFCLMPNHFHILVREINEGGISQYLHRIQTAFTKYFNIKYGTIGHLFQGPFKIVHVSKNEQLLHLSAYIHRNPRELKQWKNKEKNYTWSSYQDCVKTNRWTEILNPEIITGQFKNPQEYQEFVETSGTKLSIDEIDENLFIE